MDGLLNLTRNFTFSSILDKLLLFLKEISNPIMKIIIMATKRK